MLQFLNRLLRGSAHGRPADIPAEFNSPAPPQLLCPHCEREMGEGHDVEACARKRMSRRFFFGLVGAAAVAPVVAKVLPELPVSGIAIWRHAQPLEVGDVFTIAGVYQENPLSLDEFEERYIAPAVFDIADDFDREALGYARVKIGDPITVRRPRRFSHASLSRRET